MNTAPTTIPSRQAATTGLAVVGFITLVVFGIWLAIYAARFVPMAVDRIGSAAVYLGSIVVPAPSGASLSIVPNATTTIPFGGATTTPATTTPATPAPTTTPTTPTPVTPTAGQGSSSVTQIAGGTQTLYGLADLSVSIQSVGYLATTSAQSFVADTTVPHGSRPAVVFTVKNIGTNISSIWNFTAKIPTLSSYVYSAPNQQILRPGESIQFTLGFDQANAGSNKTISIHVNPNGTDSNSTNNDASATLTILGS